MFSYLSLRKRLSISRKSVIFTIQNRSMLSVPAIFFGNKTGASTATLVTPESHLKSQTENFILKESDQIKILEGRSDLKLPPCSTFKIPLALMGYNEGILQNENQPRWEYKTEYQTWNPIWKFKEWEQSQTPKTWIQNSTIWYSQLLTQHLQMERLLDYVHIFEYGNQNVTGCRGKNNGLSHAWLSSSLKISPLEQIAFLEKLVNSKLPVSTFAQEATRQLLYLETLSNHWQLFGKTGSCHKRDRDGNLNPERQFGWFVGWAQKAGRKAFFAQQIIDTKPYQTTAGGRAKNLVKKKLCSILK